MSKIRKSLYDGRVAGFIFSLAAILPLLLSFLFSAILIAAGFSHIEGEPFPDWYTYFSFLLPQLALAFCVGVFFLTTDVKVKEFYRGTKAKYFFLACLIQFGLFSLSFVNDLFLRFLGNFGYEDGGISLPDLNGGGIFGAILIIAVLPAIFEESIFRGITLGPLKKFSTPVAVLLCGGLFSLFHENPAQTIYQFVCGCVFAFIAVRADSVLPTMLSHFLNNAVILILTKFQIAPDAVFYVISGVALVAGLALLFFDRSGNEKKTESMKPFFATASVGIAVCAVLWIATLLQGIL